MSDKLVIRLDDAAMDRLFRGPDGAVVRDIERRCISVQSAAVRLCPVDTGRLRASISYTLDVETNAVVGYIGSNVEYVLPVEFSQPFLRPALDAARR